MKNIIFILLILICIVPAVHADINLGVETRLRGNSVSHNDYYSSTASTAPTISDLYSTQRTRLYLEGDLPGNVSVHTKLQSIGRWNGAVDLFFENAYIKFSKINELKFESNTSIDLTIGRQPLQYGNGLVIGDADGATGFNAIKSDISFNNDTELDVFMLFPTSSTFMLGSFYDFELQKGKYDASLYSVFQSTRGGGELYIGARVDIEPKKDVDIHIDIAKQVNAGGPGLGLDAGIELKSINNQFLVSIDMLYGTNDFNISTTYLPHEKYGEYFMSHRYDVADSTNVSLNENNKLANLGILKFGIDYLGVEKVIVSFKLLWYRSGVGSLFGYFIYDPNSTFLHGSEIDISATYRYSSSTFFRLSIGSFSPLKNALHSSVTGSASSYSAMKILLECIAKF